MNLIAVVLAAGAASRFGGDKLGAVLDGKPLLFQAIEAARAAPVSRIIVIARDGIETGSWPANPPVETLIVASSAMSQSLKVGIAAARRQGAQGLFVFLGDMPRIPHDLASRLAACLGDSWAAAPRHEGRPGHPVLFTPRAFPLLDALEGDAGAGKLLRERADIAWLDCAAPEITLDVDYPDDLVRLSGGAD